MCFGSGVDDLINSLHGEVEGHKFALHRFCQIMRCSSREDFQLTTGCSPFRAAPTVRPQKPDSVMGLSMTLFSPNRSSRPFVTLYLRMSVSGSVAQSV